MKKKWFVILLTVICLLLLIGIIRTSVVYFENMYPNKEFFGNNYSEIIIPTTVKDFITAKEVLNEVDSAMSTITTDEKAEQKFGELSHFCITDSDAVKENHSLKLIAAKFKDSDGYVWIKYSNKAYDKKGDVSHGSFNILSRLEVELKEGKWVVTSVKEHP